jgi:hypothetical protein
MKKDEMMKDNNSLILADEKDNLVELGHQVKALLPGGNKLSDNQAISIANYAALTKANPFRGEIYGYPDNNGQLVLVDGYKLLIRWAKSISDYDEDYGERLPVGVEGIEEGDIGYRCTIMRHDKKIAIKEYVDMGAPFREAYDLVSNKAVGIVKKSETYNFSKKKPIPSPKGWSWDEVARKRALKNVLNRAYPMPSIEQMAKMSWDVEGVETVAEDWAEPGIYQSSEEAEAHARLAAQERERQEKVTGMDDAERANYAEEIKTANEIMSNNGDDDLVTEKEKPLPVGMDASSKFWKYVYSIKMERAEAGEFIREAAGDFDKALKALKRKQNK